MSVAFAAHPSPGAYWAQELLNAGYCIIPDLMPKAKVSALEKDLDERFTLTPFCEGAFYGTRTKRFGSLLKRSALAAEFVMNETILDVVQTVLGPYCDRFQLNLAQGLGIWPGEAEQVPHRDHDMWPGPKGKIEYLVNVMWPITPFAKENGATLIWPGSHRHPDSYYIDREEAVFAEMEPGSVLLFLGSTLHGGGANRTLNPRTGIVVGYSLGWLKSHEAQLLAYPPEVARQYAPELAALIGYQLHRPNIGNYEGQCPSLLLAGAVPEYLPAVDGLGPDHAKEAAAFKARQTAQPI